MPREVDDVARRLLAELTRLEREPWPAVMLPYGDALTALARRCERRPGKAELYRWAQRELHALVGGGDSLFYQAQRDALADVVALAPERLLLIRSTLRADRPPNLASMIRAAVRWRGRDILESLHQRHDRRRASVPPDLQTAISSPHTRLLLREVCGLLDHSAPPDRALLLIGQGETIAGAARRLGASRQQIYRARERLHAATERWTTDDPPPVEPYAASVQQSAT